MSSHEPTAPRPGRHRTPYVGEGIDGALRSAEIDRSEADGFPTGSQERERCLASAKAWEKQARQEEQTWLAMEAPDRE